MIDVATPVRSNPAIAQSTSVTPKREQEDTLEKAGRLIGEILRQRIDLTDGYANRVEIGMHCPTSVSQTRILSRCQLHLPWL